MAARARAHARLLALDAARLEHAKAVEAVTADYLTVSDLERDLRDRLAEAELERAMHVRRLLQLGESQRRAAALLGLSVEQVRRLRALEQPAPSREA